MNLTFAVAVRVGKQLVNDRRFLALSIVAPIVVMTFLWVTLDALLPGGASGSPLVMPIAGSLIFFFAYLLCSLAVVEERVRETLPRMFINGYRRHHVITGYLCSFTALATVQTAVVVTVTYYLFSLNYSLQQMALLFLVVWLLAVISVALGIFVSNFARTTQQVIPFIPLVLLPNVFLSGILTNGADNLVHWARLLSYLTPLRYAANLIRDIITTASIGSDLWQFGVLLGIGAAVLVLAAGTLRETD